MPSGTESVVVTGGGGYCGSRLVPRLLDKGYRVAVYDIDFFGHAHLPVHPALEFVKGDIRDSEHFARVVAGHDAVVHLACISNDASFELDEALSTSINLDAFEPLVDAAKRAGVRRFVYASSSSVYGVSAEPDVTEEHPLVPLTLYNKFKGMCEPLLLKHTDADFTGVIFRPATVCGAAPRQRLDLSVNILTNHAVSNGRIKVFGGAQLRPNLHIEDYCEVVELLLEAPAEKVADQIFNVGYQNMSIMDIALVVKGVVERMMPELGDIGIEVLESDDPRSYHINSDKIRKVLGFAPTRSVEMAVEDLVTAFADGRLPDSMSNDRYYNVRTLKAIQAR